MIVLNKLHHSDEQWSALAKQPDDGPVFMINLFKCYKWPVTCFLALGSRL